MEIKDQYYSCHKNYTKLSKFQKKYVWYLHATNYKTLMNKIKEKLNKSSTHGFEVSILLRCQVFPN